MRGRLSIVDLLTNWRQKIMHFLDTHLKMARGPDTCIILDEKIFLTLHEILCQTIESEYHKYVCIGLLGMSFIDLFILFWANFLCLTTCNLHHPDKCTTNAKIPANDGGWAALSPLVTTLENASGNQQAKVVAWQLDMLSKSLRGYASKIPLNRTFSAENRGF